MNFAETNIIRSAAEMVDRKRVREWKQNKIQLTDRAASTKGSKWKRLEGGGRKAFNIILEENLLEWIYDRHSKGLRVSRKLIMKKAKIMYNERCKESDEYEDLFIASTGWLRRFMNRYGLLLRRKTTISQHDHQNLIDKIVSDTLFIFEELGSNMVIRLKTL